MKYLRWLLLPFSLLYGLVVVIRNWLYDAGLFKSHSFHLPVISIGNLAIGGVGKSPMAEYLIHLLKDHYTLATLSRGYGRSTKGFIIADVDSTATSIGDEPSQFKRKFPHITVAVCEDRVTGINRLKDKHELIILDDAYQHRPVKPSFSILLFDYTRLNEPNFVLPAGNLREPFSGRWRADVIIISKCPETLTPHQEQEIAQRMGLLPYQRIFFTHINYQTLTDLKGRAVTELIDNNTTVFLLTGIANTRPLVNYLRQQTANIIHHNYPDHHRFSKKNIAKLADDFAAFTAQKKVIITTEKDAQRLADDELQPLVQQQLPIWVLPIGITFLNNAGQQFDDLILEHVRQYTTHHSIH